MKIHIADSVLDAPWQDSANPGPSRTHGMIDNLAFLPADPAIMVSGHMRSKASGTKEGCTRGRNHDGRRAWREVVPASQSGWRNGLPGRSASSSRIPKRARASSPGTRPRRPPPFGSGGLVHCSRLAIRRDRRNLRASSPSGRCSRSCPAYAGRSQADRRPEDRTPAAAQPARCFRLTPARDSRAMPANTRLPGSGTDCEVMPTGPSPGPGTACWPGRGSPERNPPRSSRWLRSR